MKECRINAQNDIIENVILALNTCSQGIGMLFKYDMGRIDNGYSSTLIFTPKKGYSINPTDFFLLGYYVGRDYDGK